MLHTLKKFAIEITYKSIFGKDIVETINIGSIDLENAKKYLIKVFKEHNITISFVKTTCTADSFWIDEDSLMIIGEHTTFKPIQMSQPSMHFSDIENLLNDIIIAKDKMNQSVSLNDDDTSEYVRGKNDAFDQVIKMIQRSAE